MEIGMGSACSLHQIKNTCVHKLTM